MTDHFGLLQQPRRPWLDPEQLKQKYHELARTGHPDLKAHFPEPVSNGAQFSPSLAALNEAYSVLSNPKLRLRHLLELEGGKAAPEVNELPSDLTDLFMEAATLIGEADDLVQKRNGSTSVLAKSLLQAEILALGERAKRFSEKLNVAYAAALEDLRRTDRGWMSDRSKSEGELRRLIQRFAYLDRWMDQVREKQFQLSS